MRIRPVILCGGSGTRLWPLSTPELPKQFLSLTAPDTMIALTSSRLHQSGRSSPEIGPTLVVGSKRHQSLLRQQLPDADLILEPFGRNSAPAVAAACLEAGDDLLLILPADHDIKDPSAFLDALEIGAAEAEAGAIVTFGIQPTHPATGYGYIESEATDSPARGVSQFVEKPDLETAKAYLASARYFWNAGIFLFKASVMIDAFEAYAPEVLKATRAALRERQGAVRAFDPERFAEVEDISIDYAIMEKASNIKVIPTNMGWNDVGDYQALWEMSAKAPTANVTVGPGLAEQSEGLFIRSEGPKVYASGLKDCIIVAKPDTIMITPRGNPAAVKSLGAAAQKNELTLGLTQATKQRAKQLLWDAFDSWTKLSWDKDQGGFVESLNLDGTPNLDADRRVRVQARQVFSFARAIALGWHDPSAAEALVDKGLDYLNAQCKHPDGGWVKCVNRAGETIDETRDLYDHAFIIMAGAAAYAATGKAKALQLAEEALDFVEGQLSDPNHGGFLEGLPATGPRRANPHMHLLEAFLTLYDVTGDAAYLFRAAKIVTLFETHFFIPHSDCLCEFFESDWSPVAGDKGQLFEPGHHYEWATLLAIYDKLTQRDTLSWRRRLIRQADRFGRDKESGMAYNTALPDGSPIDDNRRIWHQLEMFRARVWHPETAPPGDADRIFETVQAVYFSGMPRGTWLDQTGPAGEPNSTAIPASILYHLVTALSPVLETQRQIGCLALLVDTKHNKSD